MERSSFGEEMLTKLLERLEQWLQSSDEEATAGASTLISVASLLVIGYWIATWSGLGLTMVLAYRRRQEALASLPPCRSHTSTFDGWMLVH